MNDDIDLTICELEALNEKAADPHVAEAIAILKKYKEQCNQQVFILS